MGEVARAHKVGFVDLFHPTQELYTGATKPYTINGIHLTAEGNRMLAVIIDRALFPEGPMFKRDAQAFEKLRQAVLEKNFTGSTAIARWMVIRSTAVGQTFSSWTARPIAW